MSSPASHNKNSSAVRRIMSEARELRNDDSTEYTANPLETDLFEWHCTIRGPADTEFEGGLYHCRISLPTEYPFKAPSIMVLTPNGRFELNKKICISFTSYHEELWQPAWGVRTAIIGVQGFFPLKGEAAVGVGAVEYPLAERKRLAALSRSWTCPDCGVPNIELLPDPPAAAAADTTVAPASLPTTAESDDATLTPTQSSVGIIPANNAVVSQSPSFNPTDASGSTTMAVGGATAGEVLKTASALSATLNVMQSDIQANSPVTPPITPLTPSSATTQAPSPVTPQPHMHVQANLPQMETAVRSRTRAPLWLDLSIVLFSFLIAYMAGRRLTSVWEFVTEHV